MKARHALCDRALPANEGSALAAQGVSGGHGLSRRASQSFMFRRETLVHARRIATTEDRSPVRSRVEAGLALAGLGRSRIQAGSVPAGSGRARPRTNPGEEGSGRAVPRKNPDKEISARAAISTRSCEVDSRCVTTTASPNRGASSPPPPANPHSQLLHPLRQMAVRVGIDILLMATVRAHRCRAIPSFAIVRGKAVGELLPGRIARKREVEERDHFFPCAGVGEQPEKPTRALRPLFPEV